MALSFDNVVSPLTSVLETPYLSVDTWKVTVGGSRRIARLGPNPLKYDTYAGFDGVATSFQTAWDLPKPANTTLEVKVGVDTTREDGDSFTFIEPTIVHKAKSTATHKGESECKLTLPIYQRAAPFSWKYQHPTFNVEVAGKLERDLAFGLPTDISATCFVDEAAYLAFWASYDALRSGVKQYCVIGRKELSKVGSDQVKNAHVFASYSSSCCFAAGVTGDYKNINFAARASCSDGFVIGARRDCPYSGSTVATSFSTATKSVQLGVQAIKGLWTVGLTIVLPNVASPKLDTLGFGFKLAYN